MVAPHAGARIETPYSTAPGRPCMSLPMRERELKLAHSNPHNKDYQSLPMRERELKQTDPARYGLIRGVAPHAGARIETGIRR